MAAAAALIGAAALFAGCAEVRPYEREFLADPIMSFDNDASDVARSAAWLETREGSTGGTGGAGGGCACK
jgi:hypothetical protein